MKLNKRKIIILFLSILIGTLVYFKVYYQTSALQYSQEYVVGQSNIKGNVDTNYFFSSGQIIRQFRNLN